MEIRPAKTEDVPAVMAIVSEVVEQMAASGNPQWDRTYPTDDRFLLDVEDGGLFVATEGGVVQGFVTLDYDQPASYEWVEWSRPEPYLAMHRIAVATSARGRGVAARLEDFAVDLAQERRCTHIRVDTNSRNEPMRAFLTGRGYRYVGQIRLRGLRSPFVCFEKLL